MNTFLGLLPLLTLAAAHAQDAASTQAPEPRVRNVAIVVFQDVELLDFAGPGEVFGSTRVDGRRAFQVYTVSDRLKPVRSQGFVTITPQYTYEDCPAPDIVVVPGGSVPVTSTSLRGFLRRAAEQGELVMSVCNGALALAGAGLLEGLEVTTHHGSLEMLQVMAPEATVLTNRRFVDHGRVLTTAGVSAGIDGALQVVRRLHGEDTARAVARYMEYDWRPEELAELHARPGEPVGDGATRELLATVSSQGVEAGLAQLSGWEAAGREVPSVARLNRAGYALLHAGRAAEARALFELLVERAPTLANPCDSLAEACELAGDGERALHWSERALELLESDATLEEAFRERLREAAQARVERLREGTGQGAYACPPCGLACDRLRHEGPGHCPNEHCGMELVRVGPDDPGDGE